MRSQLNRSRGADGAQPGRHRWNRESRRVALIGAAIVVALLIFVERAVLLSLLVLIAALFAVLVLNAALATIVLSADGYPAWMRNLDGTVPNFWGRLTRVAGRVRDRLLARPRRKPQRVVEAIRTRIPSVVWSPDGDAVCYSHLLIELHPETVFAVDSWMEVQDVCAMLAQHYGERHERSTRRSGAVVVAMVRASDVAPGRFRITGHFRSQHHDDFVAWAWAPLRGALPQPTGDRNRLLPDSGGSGGSGGLNAPGGGTAIWPPPVSDNDPDRTRILAPRTGGRPAAPAPVPADDHDATMVLGTRPAGAQADARSDARSDAEPDAGPDTETGPAPVAALVLTASTPDGIPKPGAETYRLDPARGWSVGRDRAADIRVGHSHVSRRHAAFQSTAGGWTVTDVGSKTGTFVNGTRLQPDAPCPVRVGDTVEFGSAVHLSSDRVVFRVG